MPAQTAIPELGDQRDCGFTPWPLPYCRGGPLAQMQGARGGGHGGDMYATMMIAANDFREQALGTRSRLRSRCLSRLGVSIAVFGSPECAPLLSNRRRAL
jgi:hypothetical protein